MPAGHAGHMTETLEATPFKLFFLKGKARYDFILIIYFNASSIKPITLLYTKRAEAKQLGSGKPRVNQMYPANSRPFAIYFTC